jgi:hypothetical protein
VWQARTKQTDREVDLPGAGWPEEDDVVAGFDDVEGSELGDDLPADRGLVLEVEVLAEAGPDLNPPAAPLGVDRVVRAQDPDPVITGQGRRRSEGRVGQDRRPGQHCRPILGDPPGGPALDDPVSAAVGSATR